MCGHHFNRAAEMLLDDAGPTVRPSTMRTRVIRQRWRKRFAVSGSITRTARWPRFGCVSMNFAMARPAAKGPAVHPRLIDGCCRFCARVYLPPLASLLSVLVVPSCAPPAVAGSARRLVTNASPIIHATVSRAGKLAVAMCSAPPSHGVRKCRTTGPAAFGVVRASVLSCTACIARP